MALGARRLLVACLVVAAALVAASSASASAAVSPRIIGGEAIPITDAPWQVAIVKHSTASAYYGQFCGGVIVDARRIITAAHCLDANGDGLADPGITRDVVAGMTDLTSSAGLPAQRVQIEAWAAMPGFDLASNAPGPHDAAVATLEAPGLDLSGPEVQPAALVGAGELTPSGTSVSVSGWGATTTDPNNPNPYPDVLQAVVIKTVSDPDCASYFPGGPFDPATMLCAIAPGKDSCSGDSGGPLNLLDGTLIGLVSWGPQECAAADGSPGVYTELAEPSIAAFIRAPQSIAAPVLTGTAKSGAQLTCQPGSWASIAAGSPSIDFSFATSEGVALRDWSPDATYTLSDADAGRHVVCTERARDASGEATSTSAASAAVVGPPAPAAVTPTPTPAPTPTPKPATKPVDTVAPRTTFISIRCRARRCVVRVRVADRGTPVSGVKTVRITALPTRGAVRTVTARRIAAGIYQARFSRVARGSAWFTVATRDIAGNRSAQPAIRHARVR